jgi:hypothetical protein
MKFKIWLSTFCAAFAVTTSAQAMCLAPHPVCVVVGLGYIGGLIFGLNEPKEINALQVEQDKAVIAQIVRDLRAIDKGTYVINLRDYASYNPGYGSIIRRFDKGIIHGHMGLESLYSYKPKLFKHLDTMADVIAKNVGEEIVLATYGAKTNEDGSINWGHYRLLAADAEIMYKNLFAVKR